MKDFKFVGSKYDSNMDVKEIAALVRQEIKTAIKKNHLPKGTYSVTIDRFAGGRSIDIRIKAFEFPVVDKEAYLTKSLNHTYGFRSKIADMTVKALNRMLQAYNFDNSDIMTDYFHVKFYGNVSIDGTLEDNEIKAIEAELKTLA